MSSPAGGDKPEEPGISISSPTTPSNALAINILKEKRVSKTPRAAPAPARAPALPPSPPPRPPSPKGPLAAFCQRIGVCGAMQAIDGCLRAMLEVPEETGVQGGAAHAATRRGSVKSTAKSSQHSSTEGGWDSSEERFESSKSSRLTSQMNSASSARYATGKSAPLLNPNAPKPPLWKLLKRRLRAGTRMLSPREKLGFLFVFSELILALAFMTQLLVLKSSILTLDTATARSEVKILDQTYYIKVNQMGFGFRGQSQNSAIVDYLKAPTGAGYKRVQAILQNEVNTRRIEFATLLNRTGSVLVNAGTKNRTGLVFDPSGLVSRMRASPKAGQIRTSKVLSLSELQAEGITVFRERVSALQPTAAIHPLDTGLPALTRFTVTSVFSLDASGDFLGVLVSGDVSEGKTPVCFYALEALGSGLMGLYTYATSSGAPRFHRACTLTYVQDPDPDFYSSIGTSPLIMSATSDPVPRSVLTKAATAPSSTDISDVHDADYVFATKRILNGNQNLVVRASEVTEGVAVRGVRRDQHGLYPFAVKWSLVLLLVIVAVNALAVYLALSFFILPLEKLAAKLKAKENVDLKRIGQGGMTRLYAVGACGTLGTSLVCVVVSAVLMQSAVGRAVRLAAVSHVGVGKVNWNIKVDQMSLGMRGQSDNGAIRGLVSSGPSSFALWNASRNALIGEVRNRRIEFATLVGRDGRILVNANRNRTGEAGWDPAGLVSMTLATNRRYKKTWLLSYAELVSESPPRMQEKNVASTADSKLSPFATRGPALVRYTSTPVYATANAHRASPDGVLISGDIVNGKSAMAERVLAVLDTGYAAFYLYDLETGAYRLACSAFRRHATDPPVVDVAVEQGKLSELLDPLLDDHGEHGQTSRVIKTKVAGLNVVLAGRRVPLNVFVGDFGDAPIEGDEEQVAVGFMVYGLPQSSTQRLQNEFMITTAVCALVQLGTTLLMNYVAYQPLARLVKVMRRQGFLPPQKSLAERLRAFWRRQHNHVVAA